MGAEGYTWITRYQKSLAKALDMARRETFAAGKFLGAEKKPTSIAAAVEAAVEETGSLLDIVDVSKTPELRTVCSVSAKERKAFFGTEFPDGSEIAGATAFWESFDPGMARAVTLYEHRRPVKICFAGWTLDAPAAGNGSFEEVDERKLPPPEKKAQAEPSRICGVWVGAMGGERKGLPAFLRLDGNILDKMCFKPYSNDFKCLEFFHFRDTPESIRCDRLVEILKVLERLYERGPYCYSLAVKDVRCGMIGNEEVDIWDETKTLRTTICAGYDLCTLKTEKVQLEEGKYCNVVAVMEERDLRNEREVPFDNGFVKINRRKLPPFLEKKQLSALLESLSQCDKDAYLKYCTYEWPLQNGQPLLPDWSDETAIKRTWYDFTHEERVEELAFFNECLDLMKKGKLRPEMPEWQTAKKRCIEIEERLCSCPEYIANRFEYGDVFSCLVLGKTPDMMEQWRKQLAAETQQLMSRR